ncbi:unnamed protein product [Zymoseptoria tritici ST99CH_3D1]|nr:unnamed protein product [Zymoseptoria tritici ST99CH_3D1]
MHLLNLALALFSASVVASSGAVEYPQCDGGGKLHVCCNAGSEYRSVQCYDCDAGMLDCTCQYAYCSGAAPQTHAKRMFLGGWND